MLAYWWTAESLIQVVKHRKPTNIVTLSRANVVFIKQITETAGTREMLGYNFKWFMDLEHNS